MKNLDGGFEAKNYVDKWFSNSNLLLESKEEQTEVISRVLSLLLHRNYKII